MTGLHRGPIRLVSVVGGYHGVLPGMLDHYRGLGVDESHITIHAQTCDDPELAAIRGIVADRDAHVATVAIVPWHMSLNTILYARMRAEHREDWFVVADQDELQTYPHGLLDAIHYCDRNGYDFIEGALIDRIAESGKLVAVDSTMTLWDRFPLSGLVSAKIAGTCINKVVAAKGHVKLVHGQHFALSGRGCPPADIYVKVHHFKWVDSLVKQLVMRTDGQAQYSVECRRVLEHLQRYGRIRVEDTRLLMEKCDTEYSHFTKLVEWRVNSQWFSPDLTARATAETAATA